jgi:predicted RecA/RadA family phage recombinase
MADIALTAANVRRVAPRGDEVYIGIAAVAITQGQVLYMNSDGKLALADGSAAGTATVVGVALNAAAIGQAVTYMKSGKIGGFTVSGLTPGAFVYLSDTAGALADAAGTVSFVCGRIIASSDTTPSDQLYLEINYSVPGV